MIYKLPLDKLYDMFDIISSHSKLYMPIKDKNDQAEYGEYHKGISYATNLNTIRSAKDFLFPQIQDMASFKVDGHDIKIIDDMKDIEDFVIFGMRACDVRSFDILDRVFLNDPVDTMYQKAREHATIISMACTKPDETCFCMMFDIDMAMPEGDIRCHMIKDYLYLKPLTDKGDKLIDILKDILTESDKEAIDKQVEDIHAIADKLPLKDLKKKDFTKKSLEIFHSPRWSKLSQSCIGCGACTFVCPTCQCFDIKDFDTGHGIKRFRCWDSCMYSDFTLMAAGNPRHTQLERFRQRFMHKMVYYPEKNDGIYSCVGCGRCLAKCPISMNIVKVFKSIGGDYDK